MSVGVSVGKRSGVSVGVSVGRMMGVSMGVSVGGNGVVVGVMGVLVGGTMMIGVSVGKMIGVSVGGKNVHVAVGGNRNRVGVKICPGVGPMVLISVPAPSGVIDGREVRVIGVAVTGPVPVNWAVGALSVWRGAKPSKTNPMQ
jgi:hypothetical protein